ncbi:uncharacterized protein [Primulina eburnea]|uniref:uncharacterized protein n=1 Tax=Primulina eburnea TaxID=1245227 RepID=UPI003C6C3265
MVADDLSKKHTVIAHLSVQRPLQAEIQIFELAFYAKGESPNLATLIVQPTLRDGIRAGQTSDEQLQKWRQRDEAKGQRLYTVVDDIVRYRDRLCVPDSDSLRGDILSNVHRTPYSIHPGTTKMYKDLQTLYWWPGMKRDILRFVSEYRRAVERVIQILKDLLRAFIINFQGSWEPKLPLAEFSYNNGFQASIGMAPYKALYERKCRSPVYWDEVGERAELGLQS